MASPSQRYRITVTPIEKDGLQCSGRCTIELEHRAQQDWMRLLEVARRRTGLSGTGRTGRDPARALKRRYTLPFSGESAPCVES